jgi:DNA-directed RNA polymerase subunit alpha
VELDLTGLVLPQRIEVLDRSEDGRSAQFVVMPLERGFGQTLGNSVRRILLSSLPGAAVWAFRMDGVVHEHQTVAGVSEDVHQIIQNLKGLVLRLDPEVDTARLEVRASEAGAVKAGMIEGANGVEILDAEHHLFTLQEDREVHLELHVNKGRGFVSADDHELPKGAPVDLVRIDAIYNPVLRANFAVEETRVGQRTDFDRLTLRIETNGSLLPEDAVAYGGGAGAQAPGVHAAVQRVGRGGAAHAGRGPGPEDAAGPAGPSHRGPGGAECSQRELAEEGEHHHAG